MDEHIADINPTAPTPALPTLTWDEELAALTAQLNLTPNHPILWLDKGILLCRLNHWEEAITAFQQALAQSAENAEAWSNYAYALNQLKQFEEAKIAANRALSIKPDYFGALENLLVSLNGLGQMDKSIDIIENALISNNLKQNLWLKLAAIFNQLGDKAKELDARANAYKMDGDNPESMHNVAGFYMVQGKFLDAWPYYLKRVEKQYFRKDIKDWTGEDLTNKSLLINPSEGMGDQIHFIRYINAFTVNVNIIVIAPASLRELWNNFMTKFSVTVVAMEDLSNLPKHIDYQTSFAQLPGRLGATVNTIPNIYPYFGIPQLLKDDWKKRLLSYPSNVLKVGLVWAGGHRPDQPQAMEVDKIRSLHLSWFKTFNSVQGAQFFSLQIGDTTAIQLKQLREENWGGPEIHDLTHHIKDFLSTAAFIHHLDLVIACDTSTAHLAGSLNKPVWILNRYNTCWRWFLNGDTTPWYPSMRIFRQPAEGDWASVINNVKASLIQRVEEKN